MKLKSLLIMLLFVMSAIAFGQVDRSKMPEAGPAPEIKLGNYETFQLDNGLKVIVVENHKVPKVTFNLVVDRDPIREGKHVGYVQLAGQLLRTGTKNRPKDRLDEEIDFIGASLYTNSTSVGASGLSKYTEKILDLMSDVVLHPDFKQEELEKLKKQTLSQLASEKDDPNAIAEKVKDVLVYGKEHPYGEIMTEESVKSVTLEMCKNYYDTFFKPNISYLVMVGDITPEKAKEYAEKYFGSWQKGDVPHYSYKFPKAPLITKIAVVDRPGAVQSVVHIAYPVKLKRNSKDVIPAKIMNALLGGNFSSMLNLNLREKHAYTYGARSSIQADKLVGEFDATWETRTSATDSSIAEALKEMKNIRTKDVDSVELAAIKKYFIGSFARSLENPSTIATFALNIERYDLPKDYYKNYLKNVNAVDLKDVRKMARKYVKPNKAYIIVVGDAKEIADKLKKFSIAGKVDYYDALGNKYNPAIKKLPKGITAREVIENYVKAIGGKEKLLAIKDKTTKMSGMIQGMNIKITHIQKAPDKLYMFTDAGVFQQTVVFNKDKGYSEAMGQRKNLDEDKLRAMKMQADPQAILHLDKLGIKTELVGIEKVNGEDAYVLSLETPWGSKITEYYSVKTGLLLRQIIPVNTPQGSFTQTTDYSDYREVKGLKFPFMITQQMGPQSFELKVDSVEINTGVSDDLFKVD